MCLQTIKTCASNKNISINLLHNCQTMQSNYKKNLTSEQWQRILNSYLSSNKEQVVSCYCIRNKTHIEE